MEAIQNALPPFFRLDVKGCCVEPLGSLRNLPQDLRIGVVIDAPQIDKMQQPVFCLPWFSFFEVGWIHQPLHPLNVCSFQALIRIAAQLLHHVQGERIMRWLAQFFDQMRLA